MAKRKFKAGEIVVIMHRDNDGSYVNDIIKLSPVMARMINRDPVYSKTKEFKRWARKQTKREAGRA